MDVVNYLGPVRLQIIYAKHSILIDNKEGRNYLACHTVTQKPVDDSVCQVILAVLI